MRLVAVQLAVAVCALVGGAWLVGVWMVGVVVMLLGLAVGALALTSEISEKPPKHRSGFHPDHPIERFRRAK